MFEKFNIEQRIYYHHTDAGGVVYHSKYLDFCEQARTEYLRSKGIIQSQLLKERGIGFVLRKCECIFKQSAKLDDLVLVSVENMNLNGLKIETSQKIIRKVDLQILFELKAELVCVNQNHKLIRIPEDLGF